MHKIWGINSHDWRNKYKKRWVIYLTWNAAFKMSSDFAWSLSNAYILPLEGLYVTIYFSFCHQSRGYNPYILEIHRANQEKDTSESMREIFLKFDVSQKGAYLKERLYGKICTRVLECIPKSWSCQTLRKQTLDWTPNKRSIIKSKILQK